MSAYTDIVAPSPTTIPTSFVPKQPVRTGRERFTKSGGNLLMTISLVILGAALLACAGVFAYERYLTSVSTAKQQQVADAENSIDQGQLENFIRARDRFTAAKGVLDTHVAASRFFSLIESLTLGNVRFTSLSFVLASDRSAQIRMDGVAKSFNALAAESSAFAAQREVKRAIFSGIRVLENKTVSFSLDADLEPSLLEFLAAPSTTTVETVPAATTSTASTTSSGTASTTPPSNKPL